MAALEIEGLPGDHAAVSIAAVVGVPDPRCAEVAVAFVELRPGQSVGAEGFVLDCSEVPAPLQGAQSVRFWEEWPMSSTKLEHFALRDQLCAELGLTS